VLDSTGVGVGLRVGARNYPVLKKVQGSSLAYPVSCTVAKVLFFTGVKAAGT